MHFRVCGTVSHLGNSYYVTFVISVWRLDFREVKNEIYNCRLGFREIFLTATNVSNMKIYYICTQQSRWQYTIIL